jgi:putative aldouronate transport system permease protein
MNIVEREPLIISQTDLESLRRLEIEQELQETKYRRYWEHFKRHWILYAMIFPTLFFLFIFRYMPILEVAAAFRSFESGIDSSQHVWYGFFGIQRIVFGDQSAYFWRAFRNTFTLSMYGLIFGFPIPIILAIMFSEIKLGFYRAAAQVATYLPRFVSTIVITMLITMMFYRGFESPGATLAPGVLHRLLQWFGAVQPGEDILGSPRYFRAIFIVSGIWEGAGFGSIVFFAAVMAISPTSYEAAKIDGANKLDQIRYVTLPGIAPTLTIMLILRIGSVLSVGFDQIMLITFNQDPTVWETADVISTFVVRLQGSAVFGSERPPGLSEEAVQAVATSADLFNSLIGMFLVLGANFISRRVSNTTLF